MSLGKIFEDGFHALRASVGAWKCRHTWKRIEPRKVVFNQFQGGGFGCNQKYIALELLRRRRDLDLVWIVKDMSEGGFPDGIRKVSWKSPQALEELATARVWCANHNLGHFVKNRGLVKKPGQFYLQTWHGSFGIKRCTETLGAKEATMLDVFLANCEWEAGLAHDWFAPSKPRIICAGHPRNDIVVGQRSKVEGQLQTANSKLQTLLYIPTFRDDGALDCYLTDFTKTLDALKKRWPGDWKIQVRLHPHMRKKGVRLAFTPDVEDVTTYPDIQELLANADAVISDYSSCIFDFALSGRPAFIYATDREKYETDRGFYYPLSETPFPVAENDDALASAIASFDDDAYSKRLGEFFTRMGNAEDGHAAARAADEILAAIDAPLPDDDAGCYSVSIVADTHFDAEPLEKYHRGGSEEVKASSDEFAEMWRRRIPSLLDAAQKCLRGDTAFTLHLGDFINGGTGDAETLRKMLDDGYAVHKNYFTARPLQLVAGNHDVLCANGSGVETFREWFGGETNRMFRQGEDVWMIFDYNNPPPIETVEKWFAESEGARWTFVASHMPLAPCGDSGPRRLLYGECSQSDSRRALLRLVAARRNCVVLAAHVHNISYSVFSFPEGRLVQFVASSLWRRDELRKIRITKRNLKKWYTKLGGMDAAKRNELLDTVEPFRPYVREFRAGLAVGHFLLEVTPKKVQVKIFGGDSVKPGKTMVLRKFET